MNARDLWSSNIRSRTRSKTMDCPCNKFRYFDAICLKFPSHVGVVDTKGSRTNDTLQVKLHIPKVQRPEVLESKHIGVASRLLWIQQKLKSLIVCAIREGCHRWAPINLLESDPDFRIAHAINIRAKKWMCTVGNAQANVLYLTGFHVLTEWEKYIARKLRSGENGVGDSENWVGFQFKRFCDSLGINRRINRGR